MKTGAIGNYWARETAPTETEIRFLKALADSTAVALENVGILSGLERRIKERIESFSWLLKEELGENMTERGSRFLDRIASSSQPMSHMIEDLLDLCRTTHATLQFQIVDLTAISKEILNGLVLSSPEHHPDMEVDEDMVVKGDPLFLQTVMENLIQNAWKFTKKATRPFIKIGKKPNEKGGEVYYVRDNGVGFDMQESNQLFQVFRRLHSASEFPGVGVGLTTVKRIIQRHGGEIWPEAIKNQVATFYFTFEPPRVAFDT